MLTKGEYIYICVKIASLLYLDSVDCALPHFVFLLKTIALAFHCQLMKATVLILSLLSIKFGIIVKEYVNRMTLYRRFQNTYTAHRGSRCSSIGYNDNSEGND